MDNMIEIMKKRLSEMDTQLLKEIYAPTVVAIPPHDTCKHMCVTPDGCIRYYGRERLDSESFDDVSFRRVYIESKDCGLSWKKHLMSADEMGEATYEPQTGRYMSYYPQENRIIYPDYYPTYGEKTYVMFNDNGYDAPPAKFIPISDYIIQVQSQIRYLQHWKRWLFLGEYKHPDTKQKYIQTAYSDDNGETWHFSELPKHAPEFIPTYPHKGTRWQDHSCEPTVVELSDGTLFMLERTSQDYHYQRYSYDGGVTWTDPEPSIFHGTLTMPVLYKLSDGRIICLWCNTQPLPELDHSKQWPPLTSDEKTGVWEDVFTNRDANHIAISEDDGKHWIGFRELFLNVLRNRADYRSVGNNDSRDKSVHQGEMIELPYGKLLIAFGQNGASRKLVILDVNWLYEKERVEDFRFGLDNVTTHMYIKSNSGGFRGFSGHCAWNRTYGAILCQDPDGNFEEALRIARVHDERLIYEKQGVVWNFPALQKGEVTIRLRREDSGIVVSLLDHWYNACDESVAEFAPLSFELNDIEKDLWHDIRICFNSKDKTAEVTIDGIIYRSLTFRCDCPYGLCYLHIQTLATTEDFKGTIIKKLRANQ